MASPSSIHLHSILLKATGGGSRNVAPNDLLPKPRQLHVTHPLAFQGVH